MRRAGYALYWKDQGAPACRLLNAAASLRLLAALFCVASFAVAVEAAPANPEGSRMETISLPQPRADSGFSVERALRQRRSIRDFRAAAMTLDEVAQLLWSAQGVTGHGGLRTAPSAGALYPLEVGLVAGNVTGLHPGVYRYNSAAHSLTAVVSGDRRGELAQAAFSQQWMAMAPAVIAFGAIEERTTRKYGDRGIGYVYIEVGHAAQNVFLQATALGLGAAVVGAFDDERTAAILNLPGGAKTLYLMPVGQPASP